MGEIELIVVVGPTGAGKSRFAEQLALERGGEIINADSQQFYRGLDIGTGKTDSLQSHVKHWLLDVCEPGEYMTATRFAAQADQIISQFKVETKLPVIAGGTGLYIRALLEGLDDLPSRDPIVRDRLQREWEEQGGIELHRRLATLDPVSAARIHPNDPSRLVRYLEIYEVSGQVPSSLQARKRPERLRYQTHLYYLQDDRERLRAKIADRVRAMLAAGWLEETRRLAEQGIDWREIPNKPIGYAELAEVLRGKSSLEAAEAKIVQKTQQYAKRQNTFFRGLIQVPAYSASGSKVSIVSSAY